jgi:hypothetical protein
VWVVQAQFDPSDNRGHQPKTDGNTKTTAGNKLVAAESREKAFNKFVYYNFR